MRRSPVLGVALCLFLWAVSAHAQVAVNPQILDFVVSPDHSAVLPNGLPVVNHYEMQVFLPGGTSPVQIYDIAKPTPDQYGLVVIDILSYFRSYQPGVTYVARIVAIGPLGQGASTFSNQFSFGQCTVTLSQSSQTYAAGSSTGSVNVSAASGCAWKATSNAAWVTTSGSGTGPGSLAYAVAANTTNAQRSATITLGNASVAITQSASKSAPPPATSCGYIVSPATTSFALVGGAGQLTLTVPSGCSPTPSVSSSVTWITPGTVAANALAYIVFPNATTTARSGSIVVGGVSVNVSQAGSTASSTCTATLGATGQSYTASGGKGSVALTTQAATCKWTATSSAGWLKVSPTTGTGPKTLAYTVAANTAAQSRSAVISVGNSTLTVTQQAAGSTGPATAHRIGLGRLSTAGAELDEVAPARQRRRSRQRPEGTVHR